MLETRNELAIQFVCIVLFSLFIVLNISLAIAGEAIAFVATPLLYS